MGITQQRVHPGAGRIVTTVLALSSILIAQGCTTSFGGVATTDAECTDRVLDLRLPPTRASAEMPEGRAWTAWSCDEGFDMRVDLPDGTHTSMLSRVVAVDSYGSPDPDAGVPTEVDVHSTALNVDTAAALAGQVASDLGIDASELRAWSIRAQAATATATTTDPVKTSFMRGRVGYVGAELQVVHDPLADTTYVHLILSWTA